MLKNNSINTNVVPVLLVEYSMAIQILEPERSVVQISQ